MKRVGVAVAIAMAGWCCTSPKPVDPAGPAARRASADRAYVVDASGLVEIEPATGTVIVIAPASGWCGVDARAGVVWFVSDDGLAALDLATRKVAVVVRGELGAVQPIIQWGNQRVGGESRLSYAIGLELAMTATPAISVVVGCEGDAAIMCFEDDLQTMRPSVAAEQRRAGTLKLVDAATAAALAARGAGRSLWSPVPPAAKPPKPPAVSRRRCSEQPERCGALVPVPGSRLWLVTTDNSRGDYFHETRELWDPVTREYVRATPTGLRRTRSIPDPQSSEGSSDYGGLRVSPAGLSYQGYVFDARQAFYAPNQAGTSCGWASGGWRVLGPTDDPADSTSPHAASQ